MNSQHAIRLGGDEQDRPALLFIERASGRTVIKRREREGLIASVLDELRDAPLFVEHLLRGNQACAALWLGRGQPVSRRDSMLNFPW